MTIKFADIARPPQASSPSLLQNATPKRPSPTQVTKTKSPPVTLLPDWVQKATHTSVPYEVYNRIEHLRRMMLVHCCIYYWFGDNVVSDHTWQDWAWELARLQKQHGYKFGFYDDQFEDWDGSTGYHLKYDDGVRNKAMWLLRRRDAQNVQNNAK